MYLHPPYIHVYTHAPPPTSNCQYRWHSYSLVASSLQCVYLPFLPHVCACLWDWTSSADLSYNTARWHAWRNPRLLSRNLNFFSKSLVKKARERRATIDIWESCWRIDTLYAIGCIRGCVARYVCVTYWYVCVTYWYVCVTHWYVCVTHWYVCVTHFHTFRFMYDYMSHIHTCVHPCTVCGIEWDTCWRVYTYTRTQMRVRTHTYICAQ